MIRLNHFRALGFLTVLLAASHFPMDAATPAHLDIAIPESNAYKQFTKRQPTDLSKLLYLIERFQNSDAEIHYDGYSYKAPFAASIARYFLAVHYQKETVPAWIMRWCNTSLGGKLIYVRFRDGKVRLSRDVLMEEWKALEQVIVNSKMVASS